MLIRGLALVHSLIGISSSQNLKLDILPVNAQGFTFERTVYSFNLHKFTCRPSRLANAFIQSYLQGRLRSIKAYNQCWSSEIIPSAELR